MIVIGQVSKAQGVKGEIKINPYTDNINIFEELDEIFIGGKKYNIANAKFLCNGVFLKLEGIDDRNKAELLAGKDIFIPRDKANPLDAGEYYIVDVIGSEVSVGGKPLGKLVDILQYGAADVYVVKLPNKQKVMFPWLKAVVDKVDIENKTIDLVEEKFKEIAVYED